MRRLIVFLLFLVASVWAGILVMQHPGYLLLVYQPWMVQMPLWFALAVLITGLMLFYWVITTVDRIQFWWFRVKNWFRYRREHKSYSKTQHGLALLVEGRWKKAERFLLAGLKQSFEPLMNYLGAAKAAQELHAYERRDEYIKKAYQVAPNARMAIGLTKAELEYGHEQFEQALETLTELRRLSPRHPRVLSLLEKVYVRLGNWPQLLVLLPGLRKAKVLTAEQFATFEKNIYCEIFNAANTKTLADLQKIWNDMPRSARKNADVACAYVKQLLRFTDTKTAEELIRKTLRNHWQPELARMYGNLPFINLNRQLVIAGAWLKMYGQKPELLLTLARLCARVQLWGKAKDYFERCLALGPNPEASLEYGKLLEQLDEGEDAIEQYREGLDMAASAAQSS